MSFYVKIVVQKGVAKTQSQQQKLNDLIAQIEQQKHKLAQFQHAKEQLQQHAREKLLPLYTQLYATLFSQLEELWQHLQNENFNKQILQKLDEKIQFLCAYLEDTHSLSHVQQHTVIEISHYYTQKTELQKTKKQKKAKFEDDQKSHIQHDENSYTEFNEDIYRVEQERAREAHKGLCCTNLSVKAFSAI